MKITVMNLDGPMFLKELNIRNMNQIDRLLGYCGEHLYIAHESEPEDSMELRDAVHKITSIHYKRDFKDAAVALFKIIHKVTGGSRDKETWKINV